jgi:hypothetical protein
MAQIGRMPVVPSRHVRPRGWKSALLVGLILNLGMSLEAQAATTWTVCASGCDYPMIKAAIAAPTTLDGDTLAIAAGTYTEPGIVVNKSLTLQGEDAVTTIVQAAETPNTATDRVFTILTGVSVALHALTIRFGRPTSDGGGILNTGTLTLTDSTVRGNRVIGFYLGGGGIFNTGTLTLTRSTIYGNWARYSGGGGILNTGTLTLTDSTVSGNTTTGGGGGIFGDYVDADAHSTITLTHSTVSGNTAGAGGGLAIFGGSLTLTHSTVSGNTSTNGLGGGLYTSYASNYGTLTHSTVSGNTSYGYGGGIFNTGTLTLIHSTVSGNRALCGAGLDTGEGTTLTLTASMVAKNLDGGDCGTQCIYSGLFISNGYNLDSDESCSLTAPTDRPGVDPLLGPLQKNGGPTLTHALLPGSPALGAIPWGTNGCGTTQYSDQRRRARPEAAGGACDIGAYEVELAGPAVGGWVSGMTTNTVTCKNVSSGQVVTLSSATSPWDCEAAGLSVAAGEQVALREKGTAVEGASDVGGAVVGMQPSSGGCTNLTTGQQVPFQHMQGATAASCVAAGLVIHPKDTVQIHVQGAAE